MEIEIKNGDNESDTRLCERYLHFPALHRLSMEHAHSIEALFKRPHFDQGHVPLPVQNGHLLYETSFREQILQVIYSTGLLLDVAHVQDCRWHIYRQLGCRKPT